MGQYTSQSYPFHYVFDQNASQEDVFHRIGVPMIDNCLSGRNGTIFCYGQTGSGKTYTMTGSSEFEGRGLVPRILERLFSLRKKLASTYDIEIKLSCIEIYNENVFDLLPRQTNVLTSLESLPKIIVSDDTVNSTTILRGLSEYVLSSLEQSLALIFQAILNRVVTTTPLNDVSSRGHCIFTIYLQITDKVNDGMIRTSKFNLVDLAGSERVRKSGVEGLTLNETKSINLSLHFLEQVIVSLHERKTQQEAQQSKSQSRAKRSSSVNKRRQQVLSSNTPSSYKNTFNFSNNNSTLTHIPYRNSILTTVLKDSFGGNCKTVVLSNISSDLLHYDESISTIRFAHRCSSLSNDVLVNEMKGSMEREGLDQQTGALMERIERLEALVEKRSGQAAYWKKKYEERSQENLPLDIIGVDREDSEGDGERERRERRERSETESDSEEKILLGDFSDEEEGRGRRKKNGELKVWKLKEVIDHVERRGGHNIFANAKRLGNAIKYSDTNDIEFSCVGDLALLIKEIMAENKALRRQNLSTHSQASSNPSYSSQAVSSIGNVNLQPGKKNFRNITNQDWKEMFHNPTATTPNVHTVSLSGGFSQGQQGSISSRSRSAMREHPALQRSSQRQQVDYPFYSQHAASKAGTVPYYLSAAAVSNNFHGK